MFRIKFKIKILIFLILSAVYLLKKKETQNNLKMIIESNNQQKDVGDNEYEIKYNLKLNKAKQIILNQKKIKKIKKSNFLMNLDKVRRYLNPKCSCHEDTSICLKLDQYDNYTILIKDENLNQTKSYQIKKDEFDYSFISCNPFKVLKRGKNQKILSYFISGNIVINNEIVNRLKNLIESASRYYKDWIIRIYHNGNLDDKLICELECYENIQTNKIYDNIDFCNINEFTFESMNISYLIPNFWRWLPIADSFVDIFLSRDLNSCLGNREFLAVDEWITKTNTLFHIIRGNYLFNIFFYFKTFMRWQ
jgi:hypothetical protein